MGKREDFLKRLLATFQIEAREHRDAIAASLVKLESAAEDQRPALVELIYRSAHSLKGAARAVNQVELESACHHLEDIFSQWKRTGAPASARTYDVLHQITDLIGQLIASNPDESDVSALDTRRKIQHHINHLLQEESFQGTVETTDTSETNPPVIAIAPAVAPAPNPISPPSGESIVAAESPAAPPPPHESPRPQSAAATALPAPAVLSPEPSKESLDGATQETIRVSNAKLDELMLHTEELLGTKQSAAHLARTLPELHTRCVKWRKAWGKIQPLMRVAQKKAESKARNEAPGILAPLLQFTEWNHQFMESLITDLGAASQNASQNSKVSAMLIDGLIQEMKKVLMRPISTILEGMPRMARDIARNLNKEVVLHVKGGDIEIDRQILEELKDPLVHLIRNSVDHGIESPAERALKNKPSRGAISITLTQNGSSEVEMVLEDDGAGMDPARLRLTAVKKGIMDSAQAEALDDHAAIDLIFHSGFSTSPILTDLSGRGLGMSIVREKVERLGGRIWVVNKPGQGVAFHFTLPTTRATFRGVIIRVAEEIFVFSTPSVERVVRVKKTEIQTVQGRESIKLNGKLVAFCRLGDLLGIPAGRRKDAEVFMPAVVASANGKMMAFGVDEVINEHEVLVKALGPQLVRVNNIEGVTVLEGGRLAPILHLPDLVKTAEAGSGASSLSEADAPQPESAVRQRILVVEDSITSRMLLKNILEAARYDVQTAVDGLDGFTKLRDGRFDLVVSDVEMPRLHGFELTARIRADKDLGSLPVVLVTARESQADREKGIEVGANAYIVKSSFDQSNLLEVIQRLI